MIKIGKDRYVDNGCLDRYDIVNCLIHAYESGSKKDFENFIKYIKEKRGEEKATIYRISEHLKFAVDSETFEIFEAIVYVDVKSTGLEDECQGAICVPADGKSRNSYHFHPIATKKEGAEWMAYCKRKIDRDEQKAKAQRLNIEKAMKEHNVPEWKPDK